MDVMEKPKEEDVSSHSEGFLRLNRVANHRPKHSWRTWLIGRPLPTADAPHQKIGKAVGLAVFGADALSSIAYAPQETLVILAAAGWPKIVSCLRRERNEIALLGVGISIMSLLAVMLTYSSHVFDRYHFPGILGFALAMAVCVPADQWSRVRNAAVLYIAVVGIFSTFALHDYFRWQESRVELLRDAQRAHLALSDIDAGYEPNGWTGVEGIASSPGCGPNVAWFCHDRRYRLGVQARAGETVLGSRHVDSWLIRFPDIKLLDGPKT